MTAAGTVARASTWAAVGSAASKAVAAAVSVVTLAVRLRAVALRAA